MRVIPETMICRILMFNWFIGVLDREACVCVCVCAYLLGSGC